MKKVFLSLATIALVATGSLTVTSCGGDDSSTGTGQNPNPNPTPAGLKLTVVSDPNEIYAGEGFELSITDADGKGITGAILVANGQETTIKSEDGVFSIKGPAGDVEFSASYDGKVSNTVSLTIKPSRAVSEGKGVITYKGATMDIESALVVFRGLYYADETETSVIAAWQIEAASGNNTAVVRFSTPTTPAGGDQYTYEVPTATNTTATLAGVLVGQTVDGQTNEGVTLNFGATYANNFFTGKYSAAATAINGQPFALEFDGKTPRVDSDEKAKGAKQVVTFEDAKKLVTIKQTNIQVLETSL